VARDTCSTDSALPRTRATSCWSACSSAIVCGRDE
jgi:hypothetical protein